MIGLKKLPQNYVYYRVPREVPREGYQLFNQSQFPISVSVFMLSALFFQDCHKTKTTIITSQVPWQINQNSRIARKIIGRWQELGWACGLSGRTVYHGGGHGFESQPSLNCCCCCFFLASFFFFFTTEVVYIKAMIIHTFNLHDFVERIFTY